MPLCYLREHISYRIVRLFYYKLPLSACSQSTASSRHNQLPQCQILHSFFDIARLPHCFPLYRECIILLFSNSSHLPVAFRSPSGRLPKLIAINAIVIANRFACMDMKSLNWNLAFAHILSYFARSQFSYFCMWIFSVLSNGKRRCHLSVSLIFILLQEQTQLLVSCKYFIRYSAFAVLYLIDAT